MPEPRRHAARRPLAALAIALSAAAFLTACGDTVIDSTKTEEAVQADLESSFHDKIRAVECPSDEKVEAEKTFDCTVDYADGTQATATLKIRNENADVSFVGLETNK